MFAGKSGLALLAVTAAMRSLLVGSGCSRAPKTEPLKLVFGEHCKQENDKKRVAGYVRPSGFLTFCDNTNSAIHNSTTDMSCRGDREPPGRALLP